MFGTYQRLNVPVSASNRSVIRSASMMLLPKIRFARQHRDVRHHFYRQMLEYHAKARQVVDRWRL